MKLLVLLAFAFLIAFWIKKLSAPQDSSGSGARQPEQDRIESMVQCVLCGVHVPASEAVVSSSGAMFCCEEHRRQHGAS
ncbi:PP0621 family protein [Noviherbaspirillum massiliense]|uniref:PP0621 family protein n=1 Tax=Noviherbaspirillum massiliense TaxID=1465823 RepID=UPI00031F1F90|nr:PP0621 family protein [Noviherbaspirillum massiliense]